MGAIRNLLILVMACASLPAMAGMPFFTDCPAELPAAAGKPCAKAPARLAVDAESSADIASDYDFQYYWLSGSGEISNTWETSITEIVAGDAEGEYFINGLLADTFKDAIAASGSEVESIAATYDAEAGTLTIECGQHLFDYKDEDTVIPLSILAVSTTDKGWRISKEGTLTLVRTDRGFATAASSEAVGFFIGYITPQNRIQGFGGTIYPAFNEFNGVMLFTVTPDLETEAIPQLCDIYSEVKEGKLHIYNFANFGYHVDMTMDYSLKEKRAWATDAVIDHLLDTMGEETPFYAANSLDGSHYGEPVRDDANRYYFSADIVTDNLGNSVLAPGVWGAFIGNSFLGLYPYTNIMLFYPLTEESGIETPVATPSDAPAEYFNLQGIPVTNPEPGRLYIRRHGASVAKIVY